MTTINLKDFYYWYTQDQLIEVSDEVAEVFKADARYEMAYQRRLSRHKAQYSLDCDDGIEYSACLHEPTPQELLERMETFLRLWKLSILCRRSRAAELTHISFLASRLRKLPRPRAYMRSLFASRSSVALNA